MCKGQPEEPPDPSRRKWVKIVLATGAAAGASVAIGSQLVQPGSSFEVRDTIIYPPTPTGAWWDPLVGREMRVSDFAEWQGAPGLWRAAFDRGAYVTGSGLPVVAVRVARDDSVFTAPTDVALPPGVQLYYDDPASNVRIVVFTSRCTHLCCRASWHLQTVLPSERTYAPPSPTWERFGQDPIYCACHGGQFDPMVLVKGVHRGGSAQYVGALRVHAPESSPLPVVPLLVQSDVLRGILVSSLWYDYCR